MSLRAAVIAVGDEMLSGRRRNLNAEFIAERLNERSVSVCRISTVPDEITTIAEEIKRSLEYARVVILTGGLGPTADDLTREAVAEAAGRFLAVDQGLLAQLRQRFAEFGRAMPPNNERQARLPEGAEGLHNPLGTAPGVWLETMNKEAESAVIVALPGVPWEMESIFTRSVLPRIESFFCVRSNPYACVRITGTSESMAEEQIREELNALAGLRWGIYAGPEGIEIRWGCPELSKENPERDLLMGRAAGVVENAFSEQIYSRDESSLEEVVGERLKRLGRTVGLAESCTGGLLGQKITVVAGASDYFVGGIVSYANRVKAELLHVSPDILELKGAVSREAARAMAEGARSLLKCDHALAITGIAGPTGGTPEKPVGTIYIAHADEKGAVVEHHRLPGDRDLVRRRAAHIALWLLYRQLPA